MADATPPRHEGFASRQARLTRQKDAAALSLFSLGCLVLLMRATTSSGGPGGAGAAPLQPGPAEGSTHLLYLSAIAGLHGLCLAWLVLAPNSWQRWRVAAATALRLAQLPGSAELAAAYRRQLGSHRAFASGAGLAPQLYFLFAIAFGSGTFTLALGSIGLHIPPVLGLALQALATMFVAATNGPHCATAYMAHPQAQARMDDAYIWLEPAIAPLEPLLWLAGVGADHPHRHCIAVLTAVQVWGGLVLPTLLVAASDNRAFRQYRLHLLRQQLLLLRRQLRQEQRVWTRAAAEQRRQQAAALGISLDALSSSSSGPSSPEAAIEAQTVAAQAAALQAAAAPPGLLHPGDWQYEAAFQALHRLQQLEGWPVLPLTTALCLLLYAWHVMAYR